MLRSVFTFLLVLAGSELTQGKVVVNTWGFKEAAQTGKVLISLLKKTMQFIQILRAFQPGMSYSVAPMELMQ